VTLDRMLGAGDLTSLRGFLAGGALSAEAQDRCTVIGTAGPCQMLDAVVLARSVLGPDLPPGILDVCTAAVCP
jgi:hypothetical protein